MTNTGLAAAAVTSPTTITGSGGADTIVYTEAGVVGGNNQRTITINGGNGNDSITVSAGFIYLNVDFNMQSFWQI